MPHPVCPQPPANMHQMSHPISERALGDLAGAEYCYLTTTGRVTGRPHEIEIWFALVPETATLYMLSGARDRSDWVKNLLEDPQVTVRISDQTFSGVARVLEEGEEDALARKLLVEKYERSPGSLQNWGRTALPVAVALGTARADLPESRPSLP